MNTVKAVDNFTLSLSEDASIIKDAMRYRTLRMKGVCFGVVSIEWNPELLDSVLDKWILEKETGQEKSNIRQLLSCKPRIVETNK